MQGSQIAELALELCRLGERQRDELTDYAGSVLHEPPKPHDISIA